MLISPMEHHPLLSCLGTNSPECERLGVDFLILSPNGLVGIQRKAVADLVSSLRDGRLQRELRQMVELDQAVLLIEGSWKWNRKGVHERTGYSRKEYNGLVLSVQSFGIWVVTTESIEDSAEYLRQMELWFQKLEHESLLRKPKAKVPEAIHILSHFDGVSLTRAKAIYDHFGKVPLRWDTTKEEMLKVPHLGKITVEKLWKAIG